MTISRELCYLVDVAELDPMYCRRVSPSEYEFIPSKSNYLAYRIGEYGHSKLKLLHFPTASTSNVIEEFPARHIMFSADGPLMVAQVERLDFMHHLQIWNTETW